MNSSAMSGMLMGFVGGFIGILGGLFGTWCSIRNTKSAEERRYMVRWAAYFWVGISAFVAITFVVPMPYRVALWMVYIPVLIWSIKACNKGQAVIRARQSAATSDSPSDDGTR
jgi:hypothetical protein